ncbi:larval serum protein 1 beta chain-like [Anastrepha ludens]|uniref:larval serum protein 1 beta chain-like n=1 Tax=Anastrepha ludens TaxID=28586 RepID=UPI0023AEF352|nr:larval serum protein 1 beta chain-like [Anastrepha ludens]
MKFTIVLLALVGLVAAASVPPTNKVTVADHAFLEKQKFLLEIVYRVEDPLMFEEYIKMGQQAVHDKALYTHFDSYMEKFYESYKMGVLLPRGEFFGALVKTHHKQAYGLFNYFYYAKDWETFQRNVAWARMHVNEGMFVYALTLAVIHRDDFQGLMLPSIYEIFPQYFLNSKLIYAAEKFDYNTWSKYNQYEKEFNDVYYRNNKHNNQDYFYMKDFKTYQWWKLMGLGEHWYAAEKNFPLRENTYELVSDDKYASFMKDIKIFWHPVDYTRDIEFFNKHSVLSYFTEDLGWNSYWYYLNMDYAFFLDGKTFGLNKDRRGEWWLYNIQQLLARYSMERLSHGIGKIPKPSWYHAFEQGYDPKLVSYSGVGYSYRKNYFEIQTVGNFDMWHRLQSSYRSIYNTLNSGVYTTQDGQKIDLRQPESIEYIGNYVQSNAESPDKHFYNYWYMVHYMYFANVKENDYEVTPNALLNFETMMRVPLSLSMATYGTEILNIFKKHLPPYTEKEIGLSGVEIKNVEASELVTYFDMVDIDVTNLMNDKMVFVDGSFVWDKSLYARQMRLNHKPFHFDITVQSDKQQKVVIRSFYGPKYDEYGRIISLQENRENFVELDEFVYELTVGENVIKRSSDDYLWTVKDRSTYTELYHYVMAAFDGKYELPLDISEPHSGFPDRLLLPKGWESGFPVQLFFHIAPYQASVEQHSNFDSSYSSGIGSGTRYIDNKPFGYPLDRPIDESELLAMSNIYFMDVSIYHNNTLKQYYEEYENFGHFDYNFYNHYYTKYFQ